jgi:hypothetical protein
METTTPPSPHENPSVPPPGYGYAKAGRGPNIAAVTLGAVGAVIGLGPFIFGVFAAACGAAALGLGAYAYRTARRAGGRSGRIAIVLGALALTLGIIGMVTVDQAVNDLENDLEQIGPADPDDYTPPTQAELDGASVDELWTMWGESPSDSDAENQIEDELKQRGELGGQ